MVSLHFNQGLLFHTFNRKFHIRVPFCATVAFDTFPVLFSIRWPNYSIFFAAHFYRLLEKFPFYIGLHRRRIFRLLLFSNFVFASAGLLHKFPARMTSSVPSSIFHFISRGRVLRARTNNTHTKHIITVFIRPFYTQSTSFARCFGGINFVFGHTILCVLYFIAAT